MGSRMRMLVGAEEHKLLRLIGEHKWSEISKEIAESPESVFARDLLGHNALHLLLSQPTSLFGPSEDDDLSVSSATSMASNPPTEEAFAVMQQILKAAESLGDEYLKSTDFAGNTPLHDLTESNHNSDLVHLLLDSAKDPLALLQCRNTHGCTPFHKAVDTRGGSFTAFLALLEPCRTADANSNPLLMQDNEGETPLHWSFHTRLSERRYRCLAECGRDALWYKDYEGQYPLDNLLDDDFDYKSASEPELWEQTKAAFRGIVGVQEEEEWSPLHAMATTAYYCPPEHVQHALLYHPNDLTRRDGKGRLPLHIVVAQKRPCSSAENRLFDAIFRPCMGAALVQDKDGRQPFYYAVESKQDADIVWRLLELHPKLIQEADPVTGLYPFLLAAAGAAEESCSDVENIDNANKPTDEWAMEVEQEDWDSDDEAAAGDPSYVEDYRMDYSVTRYPIEVKHLDLIYSLLRAEPVLVPP